MTVIGYALVLPLVRITFGAAVLTRFESEAGTAIPLN